MEKTIGFIGTGKAACSFGKHISMSGGPDFRVSGYLGRAEVSSKEAAEFVGCESYSNAGDLFAKSDMIIFAVPDGLIASVWADLKNIANTSGKIIAHLSGLHSSLIFEGANESLAGSIHPLTAIFDKHTAYEKLNGAYFTIEGGESFKTMASSLLIKTGNSFAIINSDKKALYHAASSTVSNLVCALAYSGESLYGACDLPKEFTENAWRSLFLENAQNVATLGPVQALTGPLERVDTDTVAEHIRALESFDAIYAKAYIALSTILVDTAQEKHPERDYTGIRNLLALYLEKQ